MGAKMFICKKNVIYKPKLQQVFFLFRLKLENYFHMPFEVLLFETFDKGQISRKCFSQFVFLKKSYQFCYMGIWLIAAKKIG